MFVCQLFVWFVIYSVVGWLWESTYCTIVERTWQNRGFLYGPYCPIYGTGIVGIMLLWHHVLEQGTAPAWYEVFFVVMVGSAVLEYVTHWALEKLFHAYWWDYSNMPLNLNGRICLPASTFFGLGGLLVVYVLYEPTNRIIVATDPLMTEFFSLVMMAVVAADTAVTASSLASIARAASAINRGINDHMDRFVLDVQERGEAVREELDTRRTETSAALAAAAGAAREAASASRRRIEQLESDERERFAAALRASHLGQMGATVRGAANRAIGSVSPDRLPDTPNREQLVKLWRDMLDQ